MLPYTKNDPCKFKIEKMRALVLDQYSGSADTDTLNKVSELVLRKKGQIVTSLSAI